MSDLDFTNLARRVVRESPKKAATIAQERAESANEHERKSSEAIIAELDAQHRCRRCGRVLRSTKSRERKIGRECLTKEEAGS